MGDVSDGAVRVTREEFSFRDAHGVEIACYEWASPRPVAVIQLAHGIGEHAGRYERTAQALAAAGYTVVADDHRGHGRTGMGQWGGRAERLGRLGPGGLRATIAAVRQLTDVVRERHPGLPVVLLGHSWGSFLAQQIVDVSADPYAALVLTGTAYRMPGYMNTGPLNKRHAHLGTTGHEWLSRDPAVADAFRDDPLTFTADVLRLFGLPDALRLLGRPRRLSVPLPVLIAIGSDDPLGGERSIRRLARDYVRRGGVTDLTAIVYPDARHEILNEVNRDEVLADLVGWLDDRLRAGGR